MEIAGTVTAKNKVRIHISELRESRIAVPRFRPGPEELNKEQELKMYRWDCEEWRGEEEGKKNTGKSWFYRNRFYEAGVVENFFFLFRNFVLQVSVLRNDFRDNSTQFSEIYQYNKQLQKNVLWYSDSTE